jgi:hypothetical protein
MSCNTMADNLKCYICSQVLNSLDKEVGSCNSFTEIILPYSMFYDCIILLQGCDTVMRKQLFLVTDL